MIKAKVHVFLKPSVLDPQGQTVTNSLHSLGYAKVVDTRISKYIELMFDSVDEQEVSAAVHSICDKLLANPNTEKYRFELEQVPST